MTIMVLVQHCNLGPKLCPIEYYRKAPHSCVLGHNVIGLQLVTMATIVGVAHVFNEAAEAQTLG